MPNTNPLLQHLLNPAYRDERSRVLVTPNPDRLSYAYYRYGGTWQHVAGYIAGPRPWPVTWFPDANVAILDVTAPVWDALRVTALGSPNGSTVISGVVEAELADWLDDPYRNKERARDIRAAMDSNTWIRRFRVAPSHPLTRALHGYTHLLGFRRSLARPLADGSTLVGTAAADKSRTMNAISTKIGPRAVALAKKGRADADTSGAINISDEMHCLMAILYALLNRRDTVILTADKDFIEIFYKAQWFFDTHYRAWLAARQIRAGQYGDPANEMLDTKGYFDGPLTLYRRHTGHLQELLPQAWQAVRVGVLYVAPDGTHHKSSFSFERGMLDMLETRSRTDGRCTDLFGMANIHVDLGPLKLKLDGLYLGIGRDRTNSFEVNGTRSSLARLDLEHSVNCCERFS